MYNIPVVQLIAVQSLRGAEPQAIGIRPPVEPDHYCNQHETPEEYAKRRYPMNGTSWKTEQMTVDYMEPEKVHGA